MLLTIKNYIASALYLLNVIHSECLMNIHQRRYLEFVKHVLLNL